MRWRAVQAAIGHVEQGQEQPERRATAGAGPQLHPPTVRGGDGRHDGQSEAGAALVAGARAVFAVEPLEHPGRGLVGHPRAAVDDVENRQAGLTGHVERPGQYEAPLGITLRELIDMAGGMRDPSKKLKFWTPGGSSTPIFTDEHLDVPLDFESVAAAGSMLGTRALQIFDETVSVVRAVSRWIDFYKHESCGKCTPCREGTWWLAQIMERLEHGKGTPEDIDKLVDICDNILGRSFCALGDGATSPVTSAVNYFREEFEAGCHTPAAELFPPAASALFTQNEKVDA